MRLRPLCDSVDLGDAIAYAKARYEAVAGAGRPNVFAFPFQGATDTLLVRIVLGLAPEYDVAQIIDFTAKAQDWFFAVDKWSKVTGTFGPVWYQDDPGNTSPHVPDHLVIGDTGTVIAVGGASGQPIWLVSSNTAVCTVEHFDVSYEDLVEMSAEWADPELIDLVHPDMVIAGFTINLVGYGTTSFTLSQAGLGLYLPAPTIYSAPWLFRQGQEEDPDGTYEASGGACAGGSAVFKFNDDLYVEASGGACAGGSATFVQETTVPASGGACAGGSAPSFGSFDFAASGGACAGGSAPVSKSSSFASSGGACGGGSAVVVTFNTEVPKPVVQAIPLNTFPFDASQNRTIPLIATPARAGSTMQFRIVAKGSNCTVAVTGTPTFANGKWTGSATFSWTAAGGGNTTFSFSAIETKNGIVAESFASSVPVTVLAPIPNPTADFFEVTTSYEARDTLQVTLRGHAARTGSTLTYHIGPHNPGLTLTQVSFNTWSCHFYDYTWQEGYYINYWVTETKDGVSKDSAMANVTIHVSRPALPAFDFTTLFPETPAGTEWFTGQIIQFDYTGAGLMADGSPITLAWEILSQPGPNIAYPDDTDSGRMTFHPIDAGAYTVRLTVSDSYGQSASKVKYYECRSSILPPTLSYPIMGSISYENRSQPVNVELEAFIEKKRPGSTLVIELLDHSSNCLPTLYYSPASDGSGVMRQWVTMAVTSDVFPTTFWWSFRAVETRDGISVPSEVFTATYQGLAPVFVPLTLSFANGVLSWAGGTPPFKFYMINGQNTPESLRALDGATTTARSVAIPITGGFCSTNGQGTFTITDASRPTAQNKVIAMMVCGVPVCGSAPIKIVAVAANTYAVTGGKAPYSAAIQGSTSNMSVTFWNGNPLDLRVFSGFPACYCSGAGVRVADVLGASAFAAFAPPTISNALCTTGCPTEPPPGGNWVLVAEYIGVHVGTFEEHISADGTWKIKVGLGLGEFNPYVGLDWGLVPSDVSFPTFHFNGNYVYYLWIVWRLS